jgi:hypothetical protein
MVVVHRGDLHKALLAELPGRMIRTNMECLGAHEDDDRVVLEEVGPDRVGHGGVGSPTVAIRVQIPDGVIGAPQDLLRVDAIAVAGATDGVVVTGSLYTVGAAREVYAPFADGA